MPVARQSKTTPKFLEYQGIVLTSFTTQLLIYIDKTYCKYRGQFLPWFILKTPKFIPNIITSNYFYIFGSDLTLGVDFHYIEGNAKLCTRDKWF